MIGLLKMIQELQESNSISHKKEVLLRYPQNKDYLTIIYNPFAQFNITSKNIIKLKGKLEGKEYIEISSLEDLLIKLSNKEVTGHQAIRTAQVFIEKNAEFEELILSAIDKNLKCRIEASIINAVYPNCIPTFNVALAKDYNKLSKSSQPDFNKERHYCSQKIDGVRAICIKRGNSISFYSRTGKEILTLKKVEDEILNLPVESCVFDGELCLIKDNIEDFQGIMKEIRKKDHIIENPIYKIFDYLTIEEFEKESGITILSERLLNLNKTLENYKGRTLQLLPQAKVNSVNQLMLGLKFADENGWEGLMIRKDVPYEGKRTNNLLKLKSFCDEEYEVLDIEIDKMRFALGDKEIEEEVMKGAIIKHKGYQVNVGSGWSIDQRRHFKSNPQEIIGKIITVQYFEETKNQDGGISLRFPTIKAIHGKSRDT